MDTVEFDKFTGALTDSLSADPDVLGLVLVGSTADASYRDARSDHDFWLVVTPSAVVRYRSTTEWLPHAADILIDVRHGDAYRSALYRNRHRVEYAVFPPDEMPTGKLERHVVAIDRANISDIASSVQTRTLAPATAAPEPLENFALLVWSAHERLARGEWLSAHHYLTGFAVDNLLELFRRYGILDEHPTSDRLDPRRRIETIAPDLAAEVNGIVELPLSQVGAALLELAERRVRPLANDLNWSAIAEVRGWL